MPSPSPIRARVIAFLLALGAMLSFAGAVGAQAPAATPAEPQPQPREIGLAPEAFVRGAPLPPWADLAPLPPPAESRRALVVRLEDTHLRVAERPVVLVNVAQQVNDAGVLAQVGQASVPFVPQYQRLLLHKAAILRGGATIDHTATVPVRFLQRETGLEQGIYSGVITASILVPDLRVGDTLVLQYSIEGANPVLGRRYLQQLPWQRQVPVQQRRVTLDLPESRPVQWRWIGDGSLPSVTPSSSVANGRRRLRFEERDIPAIELEPALPRGAAPLAWLQFSEYADWREVARWGETLFPANEPLPDELLALVQRWLRLPSPSERASAALQWVQNEIRYVSVSLGESSHRPHPPAEVLKNRYGDCKDKTLLLMRLLQAMGIPAHAALASLAAPQRPAVLLPSPLAFDHVVVQARLDDRDYYLDGTRLGQRGPLARMGQGLEDASVLVVDADRSDGLTVVRSPNRAELFRSELAETFRVPAFDEDGTLETLQQWNGLGAEVMRLTAARLDTARLERALLTGLERRYPGAAMAGAPELRDDVDLNRITLHARFKVAKLAVPNPGDGSWALRFAAANMQNVLALPPSTERRFPLALPGYPMTVVYRAEVEWPENVTGLVDPATRRIADPAFDAEVVRGFRGRVAMASFRFEPRAPQVAARDVPRFVEDLHAIDRALGPMVVTRDQIKGGGVLGLGRKSLAETLKARAETTVERSSKAIDGGQLGGDDLAAALCLRAQAEAELGRLDAALKDAREAARQAPALAAAWFCQGNAEWAHADFPAAEAAFTKALTLGQPAREVYSRRGQARFFADRLEAAADDFAKAGAERGEVGERTYPRLWQAAALQRLGRPLPADLADAIAGADPNAAWPVPALALFGGRVTPEQLIARLETQTGDGRDLALTEAWFYIGEYQLAAQQPAKAREAFEKARSFGIAPYVEHAAAGLELRRMGP